MTVIEIAGSGTSEEIWRPWLNDRHLPVFDVSPWAGARVCVLAAHPDDEVLGAGGLLQAFTAVGARLSVTWASDGEASHPQSRVVSPESLAVRRRAESLVAVDRLGVSPVETNYLGLPDSRLASCPDELQAAIRAATADADLVVAPWRGDGHPDHEAVGVAAAACGLPLVEYPIWAWHWAAPADVRVPWDRCAAIDVPDPSAKRAAIAAFVSQVEPLGPDPEDAAILPDDVLARFIRSFEVVFR